MSITIGTPTTAETLKVAIGAAQRGLGVALPGVVESYNSLTRTATVRPGVSRLVPSIDDPDLDELEDPPAIQNVPVCWPVGRGFALGDVSLSPGDPVLLVCCDRDISVWRRTGDVSEPDDARTHHWSSAVAVPGLVPTINPIPVPSDAAALASRLDAIFQALALGVPAAVPATNPATTMALVNTILEAIQAVYITPVTSCASDILKVDS